MSIDPLLEVRLFTQAGALLEQAKQVGKAFADAGLPVPGFLRPFLGADGDPAVAAEVAAKKVIPRFPEPTRPMQAEPNWIFVWAEKLSALSWVLAVLRQEPGLPIREVRERVVCDEVPTYSTLANIPHKHSDKFIRDGDRWSVVDPSQAPILYGRFAWGPPEIFGHSEFVWHRQMVVWHVVRASGGGFTGLQIMNAVNSLKIINEELTIGVTRSDLVTLKTQKHIEQRGAGWYPLPNDAFDEIINDSPDGAVG